MSKRRREIKFTRSTRIKARIAVFATGAFFLAHGYLHMQAKGALPYLNARGPAIYPGGVIVLGITLMAVASVPTQWLEWLFSTEQKAKPNRRLHRQDR
jgi:hypothetical protein